MAEKSPRIYVLAGANGAGKSSIGGAMFRAADADYFNADELATRIRSQKPAMADEQANSLAWQQGKRLLERAIAERLDYAFETTLGGTTIPGLLESAALAGSEIRIWYVGLASPELHLARVRARVARGGHDIPEATIRQRYTRSLLNLIRLIPNTRELLVYDNSQEADPHSGLRPAPLLVLHWDQGRIVGGCDLSSTPSWAKPIMLAALKLSAN